MFWAPRILLIAYIVFISLFALDVFSENLGFIDFLIAAFMHMLPTFVLIILLLISWKWDLAGAILFFIIAVVFTFFFNTYEETLPFLFISLPVFVASLLFFMNYIVYKR